MTQQPPPADLLPIGEAIRRAGSQSALGRLIGTSQATVWKWLNKGLPITPELVIRIEETTGVSRHDLRPDLYPRDEAAASQRVHGLDAIGAAR